MERFVLTLKKYWAPIHSYLQEKGMAYWFKWSLYTLITIEIFQRFSLISWIGFFIRKPITAFINYLMVLSVFLIFNAILGNRRAATILGFGSLTIMAMVDCVKYLYMQEHLYPLDFSTIPEMLALLPTIGGGVFIATLLALGFILVGVFFLFKLLFQKQTHLLKRFAMLAGSLLVLGAITTVIDVPPVRSYISEMHVRYNHYRNYYKNGFLLAFAMNIEPLIHVESPASYSQDKIRDIMNKNASKNVASAEGDIQPNVIIVMSESLFDATQLPLTFSEEPLQHFKNLQSIHGASSLISPSFAGTTSNTEFEVLTGLSISFLPVGSIPYQHHITEELPALPRIFKEHGYETVAIHSYRRTFFKRETIYPLLGFDDYISLEDLESPTYRGKYVADDHVMGKIIQMSDKMSEPLFIFAVTMQNHMPFTTPADDDFTISGNISPGSKDLLAQYIAGVRDADAGLVTLIQHFEKSPRPTILVFFGDHLPGLHAVYAETQFFGDDSTFIRHTVPALIWSNYKKIPPLENVSTSYLGGYILEQAGITPPMQFEFLTGLRDKYPIISYNRIKDSNNTLYRTPDLKYSDASEHHLIHDYWLLQHDLLFGEQYIKQTAEP